MPAGLSRRRLLRRARLCPASLCPSLPSLPTDAGQLGSPLGGLEGDHRHLGRPHHLDALDRADAAHKLLRRLHRRVCSGTAGAWQVRAGRGSARGSLEGRLARGSAGASGHWVRPGTARPSRPSRFTLHLSPSGSPPLPCAPWPPRRSRSARPSGCRQSRERCLRGGRGPAGRELRPRRRSQARSGGAAGTSTAAARERMHAPGAAQAASRAPLTQAAGPVGD